MFGDRRRACAACAVLVCTACFYTTAPEGWLPTPEAAQRQAFGGWIKVDYAEAGGSRAVEGELIAATADTLYVLSPDSLVALATRTIALATLTTHDAQLDAMTTWSALGAVSAASHGWFLLLSMPVWIIVGTTSSASVSKAPRIQSVDAAVLRPYARFPQGLPEGLDRGTLRPKATPGDTGAKSPTGSGH